jgi:glycosyltransferase involved in cell wall biosynthesis
MRIGLVTSTIKSCEQGGAEALYEGLLNSLRGTAHDVENIEVVIDETSFDSILESYMRCYDLELNDYDLIISTKAPTYMVRHPNHVSYLLHTVRVFYDMFDRELDTSIEHEHQRKIIHSLDKYGLHPDRVKKHLSIGFTPYQRLRQADPFWTGIDFEVAYPPTALQGFKPPRPGEYVFLPGRLHRWKRVDLLIRAFKHVKGDIPLKIAGTGEDECALRALADDDPRIQFLGRVSTDQLVELYAGALVVPFLPINEDYGYITIESFLSRKPVITCVDSGEPTAFVKDSETGFVVEPQPESIAEKINYLIDHPARAAEMGEQGYLRVANISWGSVLSKILAPSHFSDGHYPAPSSVFRAKSSSNGMRKAAGVSDNAEEGYPAAIIPSRSADSVTAPRTDSVETIQRVVVLDMQPIHPPVGGGRIRLLGLYHGLGRGLPTTYLGSFDWPGEGYRRHHLSDTLEEIDVPLSDAHFKVSDKWKLIAGGRTIIDVAFPLMAHLSPDFVEKAKGLAMKADVVVFSHPWVYPLVRNVLDDSSQLIVYDAQNFEGLLKEELLDDGGFGAEIVKHVVAAEHELAHRADMLLVCSNEDRKLFGSFYNVEPDKFRETPNGVFCKLLNPPATSEKRLIRSALNLSGKSAIFLASAYQPNIEAVEFICLQLAGSLPDVTFLICGGVCDAAEVAHLKAAAPANVWFVGSVTEEEKVAYLWTADIAINPMSSGSGTNIKMFDFMAVGLPIVTTPMGARGIELGDPPAAIVSELTEFYAAIQLVVNDSELSNQLAQRGRFLVERLYSWETISPGLGSAMVKALRAKRRNKSDLRPRRNKPVAAPSIVNRAVHKSHLLSIDRNRIGFLTTWQTRCGIAEYSESLIDALSEQNVECFVIGNINGESINCLPKNEASLSTAVEDMSSYERAGSEIEVVNSCRTVGIQRISIQYNPAFFGENALIRLASSCTDAGFGVSVTLHNTQMMSFDCLSKLDALGAALIVHNLEEQRRISSLGVRQVSYIPIGVLEFPDEVASDARQRFGISHAPVIGTFGFARQHKGLLEMIDAIPMLRDLYPNILFLGLNALYPSRDSEEYLSECVNRIKELDLSTNVKLETGFLEIDDVIRNLHACDVIVLPYKYSSEGASASAHTAIAARRPLIVTRQEIFRSVSAAAYQVEGTAPAILAAAIAAILSSPVLISQLTRQSQAYIKVNRWQAVADKYLRLAFPHHNVFSLTSNSSRQAGNYEGQPARF